MLKPICISFLFFLSVLVFSSTLYVQQAQANGELDFFVESWQTDLDYEIAENSLMIFSLQYDSDGNIFMAMCHQDSTTATIQKYSNDGTFEWEIQEELSSVISYHSFSLIIQNDHLYLRAVLEDNSRIFYRYSSDGTLLWSYHLEQGIFGFGFIEDLEDNIYVYGTGPNPDNSMLDQYHIIKIDGDGNLIWENIFTYTPPGSPSGIRDAEILENNNLILSLSVLGAGEDVGIIVLSPDGEIVWNHGGQTDGSVSNTGLTIDLDSNIHYGYNVSSVPGMPVITSANYLKFDQYGEVIYGINLRTALNDIENFYIYGVQLSDFSEYVYVFGSATVDDESVYVILTIDELGNIVDTVIYEPVDCLYALLGYIGILENSFILSFSNRWEESSEISFVQLTFDGTEANRFAFETSAQWAEYEMCYNIHGNSLFILKDRNDPESGERNFRLYKYVIDEYFSHLEPSPERIADFEIMNCWPNPFNSTVNIRFNLPESGIVSYSIYNTIGREVFRSPVRNYPAGVSVINWKAKELSSGNYFMNLKSENSSKIVPLLLIK